MPISKVDLNGQYLAIPFNFQNQNSHQTPTMAIKDHTPWPATSNLPVIQQKSLGDLWRYFFRMSTPPITPLALQLHSLKSLPNTKQLESMRVHAPRSSKKTQKKNACWFYIVLISQKTFQKLGCSPIRCTKNEQHTEEWALFLGHVRSVEARTSVMRDFLPLYFLHIGSTPSLSKVHIAVFRASSSSSLLAWKSARDAVIELRTHNKKKQLPDQTNQTSNCQWPIWTC